MHRARVGVSSTQVLLQSTRKKDEVGWCQTDHGVPITIFCLHHDYTSLNITSYLCRRKKRICRKENNAVGQMGSPGRDGFVATINGHCFFSSTDSEHYATITIFLSYISKSIKPANNDDAFLICIHNVKTAIGRHNVVVV